MTSRHDMRADQSADELRKIGAVTNVPTSSAEIDAAMMRLIRPCLDEDLRIELRKISARCAGAGGSDRAAVQPAAGGSPRRTRRRHR
jgi:hypothetical protein